MNRAQEKRKISIHKVKDAIRRLRARDGLLTDYDSLTIEVSSQMSISMNIAIEYVTIAKHELEAEK